MVGVPARKDLPPQFAAFVGPLAHSLDAFREEASCVVQVRHVLSQPLDASILAQDGFTAQIPVMRSSGASCFRLSALQAQAIDEAISTLSPTYVSLELARPGAGVRSVFVPPNTSDVEEEEEEVEEVVVPTRAGGGGAEEDDSEEEEEEVGPRLKLWVRKCSMLAAKLRKNKNAKPFLHPVDAAFIPDYFKNIRYVKPFMHPVDAAFMPDYFKVLAANGCLPMDLATVDRNLDQEKFKSDRDFVKAVRRVFYNAFVYNPDTEPAVRRVFYDASVYNPDTEARKCLEFEALSAP
ncbi:hypothetical protein T484DRAFT_1851784 [Baffinella frigidus]|nr:hypothetical protein T484DRAFT_1851784 [Cryptophyta sp. CCMP2293]